MTNTKTEVRRGSETYFAPEKSFGLLSGTCSRIQTITTGHHQCAIEIPMLGMKQYPVDFYSHAHTYRRPVWRTVLPSIAARRLRMRASLSLALLVLLGGCAVLPHCVEWTDESFIERRCIASRSETYYDRKCVNWNKWGQCTETYAFPETRSICVQTANVPATRKVCVRKECDAGLVLTASGECVEGSPVPKTDPKEQSGNGSGKN